MISAQEARSIAEKSKRNELFLVEVENEVQRVTNIIRLSAERGETRIFYPHRSSYDIPHRSSYELLVFPSVIKRLKNLGYKTDIHGLETIIRW